MPDTLSPLFSYASGSADKWVYSRNQFGPYIRDRTSPADPNTARQRAVRRHFARVMWSWANVLSAGQRSAWEAYARRRVLPGSSPRRSNLSGQQCFIRANAARIERVLVLVQDPPAALHQSPWITPFNVTHLYPGLILYDIDNTDEWANLDGSALVLQVSPLQSKSVNFYNGPYRRAGILRGFTGSPPAVSNFFVDPYPPEKAERRFYRALVTLGDGRVSTGRRLPFSDNA